MFLAAAVAGYLLGSIPFGLILTRAAGLGDIRQIGSGNIGATNVLRTGNKKIAAATLFLDGAKGAVAVLSVWAFLGKDPALVAAVAAFLGHVYPVWLKFKGGKGVATFIGLGLALHWPAGLITCATWLGTAYFFRISSLAALVAAAMTPAYLLAFGKPLLAATALVLSAIIAFAHRENIARLLKGTEPRIGGDKSRARPPEEETAMEAGTDAPAPSPAPDGVTEALEKGRGESSG
jgi:glycerol-3-phosphate acyltransferase PlsY